MNAYYDTGILLKLYTGEPQSAAVENFVRARQERLTITDLHWAECVSALKLKVFRKECQDETASTALEHLKLDLQRGVLQIVEVDWDHAWRECRILSNQFAGETGVRTLDTLHVAIARLLERKLFLTSDRRQAALATRIGLAVEDPTISV